MSHVEDRLRRDLPALADALTNNLANRDHEGEPSMDEMSSGHPSTGRSRRGLRTLTVAACAAAALLAAVLVTRDDPGRTAVDVVDRSLAPGGAGTWDVIPEAPIAAPAYPAATWTGTEAVFWAGSSLDRGFAYSDAAAYDPSTDTWRSAPAPGWGHPGLVSVEVDGFLFATAKGSVGRLDVDTGDWVELPAFDRLEIRSIAPGDGGIWALGPRPEEPTHLGIAFYDAATDRWDDGGNLGPDTATVALEALTNLAQPVVWTGDAVVVWSGPQPVAYDITEGQWFPLPNLSELGGDVVATRAVADDAGLVVLVESIRDGDHVVNALRWDGADGWSSLDDVELPVEDLDRTSIAMAGEWIMLLPPTGPPVSWHPASGTAHVYPDAPIRGVEGPGMVWTGTQLIVWGGVPAEGNDLPAGAGMIWTAPEAATEASTDTTMPDSSGAPTPSSWTGPGITELPPSGIAIAEDGELVLHDFEGKELARTTGSVVPQLQSSNDRMLAAVRPGETVDAVPADRSEIPIGCESASTSGGVRIALCEGEPQEPQRIERVSPTGARQVLSEAPDGSNGLGHWRSASPSPDGRWILATWSGECESLTAFLVSVAGDGPAITIDGQSGLQGATESAGIGWAPDGSAVVQLGTGVCGAAADEPGVHLLDPGTLESRLVVSQPEPGPSVHLWQARIGGNDGEWLFASVLRQLGLEGCCGEPSHGGSGVTSGARWQDLDIPVSATPPGTTDTVPFNDLVLSSEPIELDGAPAIAGDADLGPFVAYTCGDRIWTFGGAGAGDRAPTEAVRSLAATVLPHLGCTVGERPLAPGHGIGGP